MVRSDSEPDDDKDPTTVMYSKEDIDSFGGFQQKSFVEKSAAVCKPGSEAGLIVAVLSVKAPGQAEQLYLIEQDEVWIGRDPDCEINISDTLASRRHARLEVVAAENAEHAPRCMVHDNKSTNGTFFNGDTITSSSLIHHDQFVIGKTLCELYLIGRNEIASDVEVLSKQSVCSLTGLRTGHLLKRVLLEECNYCKQAGKQFALAILSIDNFEKIIEEHGQDSADAVLVEVANLLKGAIRDKDIALRYGVNDFAIVMPQATKDGTMIAIKRYKNVIEGEPIQIGAVGLSVTACIGAAGYDDVNPNPATLTIAAVAVLEKAKSRGENMIALDWEEQSIASMGD